MTDFGIARAISEATVGGGEQVWGTPHYFSPEQARGLKATPSSDVYSLGIILYELLTGQLPFSAESHTALALKHIQEEPPRAGEINPSIPQQLDDILAKVMSKEPVQRYRTAGQFGRILATYRQRGFEDTAALATPRGYTTEYFPRPPRSNQPVVDDQPTPSRAVPIRDAEQPTPVPQSTPAQQSTPIRVQPVAYEPPLIDDVEEEPAEPEFDWVAVSLGIIALIAVLGLIPLWYAVYIRAIA